MFDKATITFADGRVRVVTPQEFLAIPLGERIELLTSKAIKFVKDEKPISPLEAVRRA